jgi:Pyridoxamine 5'-phosphate oxidase
MGGALARWEEFAHEAPDLAKAVRARFDAHSHKMLATVRRDGSPRISGIEVTFAGGEVWMGMMPGSLKALDLRRDPRLAIHSASLDPNMAEGDAKLSGRAEEVTDADRTEVYRRAIEPVPEGPFHIFRVDLSEVVLTRVGDPPDHLVIESWREGRGVRRSERR